MVIDRITGGKPQEVRKTEQQVEKKSVEARKDNTAKLMESNSASTTAQVSERSKAAIKAFRLASEERPYFGRISKIAQIKAEIAQGTYRPASVDVADSIVKSVVKGA